MIRLILRRWAVVFLLLLLAAIFYWQWGEQIRQLVEKTDPSFVEIGETRSSLCYRFQKGRWMEFNLPQWTDQLKILSNAEYPVSESIQTNASHEYSLQYQVVNDRGKTVLSDTYHHKTSLTKYVIPGSNKPKRLGYYRGSELKPADGKMIKINLRPLKNRGNISKLRLKLQNREQAIKGVVVRVYYPEYNSEREIAYLWKRLPQKVRKRLAEGNVYPQEFLAQQERQNLVRKIWRPVAPGGSMGENYQRQRLHRLQVDKAIPVKERSINPAGWTVSPGKRSTIPVPQEGRKINFHVQRLDGTGPYQIGVKWYGRDTHQMRSKIMNFTNSTAEFTGEYKGGLIEIWSSTRVNIKAHIGKNGRKKSLKPKDIYLRTYKLARDKPIVYKTHSSGKGKKTPLKLDFRVIAQKETKNASARISYELVNDSGKNVSGRLGINAPLSKYDRLPRPSGKRTVTQAVSRFFLLPSRFSKIRLFSPDPVLVSAYNRPRGLAKTTRVPEDYYAASRDVKSEPSWFLFYPENREKYYTRGRSVLLTLQYHPPKRDPFLLQGNYKWESFRPSGNWSGSYLFTPRDANKPMRKEALNAAYTQIPLNQNIHPVLRSPQDLKSLSPDLIYLNPGETGNSLKVFLNGKLHFQRKIFANRGRLSLPPMPAGKNSLRISAPSETQVYMNNIASKNPDRMLRFANNLDSKGISFDFHKSTHREESLSFKLFTPYQKRKKSVVRIQIQTPPLDSIGHFRSLTIMQREFVLQPPQDDTRVPIMQSEEEFTTSGRTFYYPLGTDLPPGEYRARVKLEQGPGGYLQIYKVLPGKFEEYNILKETVLSHEID